MKVGRFIKAIATLKGQSGKTDCTSRNRTKPEEKRKAKRQCAASAELQSLWGKK